MEAQTTRLQLSTLIPGTENVQLVYNGDFQFQGPLLTNTHPFPAGWTRQADMFVVPGTNSVLVNAGAVAGAYVNAGAPVCLYKRAVTLEPNTAYVLSAYLWNFGNLANHVTTVVDMNDVFQEPQITLSYADANADLGYFVYRSFTTADTGSNVTLRVFCDGFTGTGTAPGYFPVGAQWDNVAITKSADFIAPLPSGPAGIFVRSSAFMAQPTGRTSVFRLRSQSGLPPDLRATGISLCWSHVEVATRLRLQVLRASWASTFAWASPSCF